MSDKIIVSSKCNTEGKYNNIDAVTKNVVVKLQSSNLDLSNLPKDKTITGIMLPKESVRDIVSIVEENCDVSLFKQTLIEANRLGYKQDTRIYVVLHSSANKLDLEQNMELSNSITKYLCAILKLFPNIDICFQNDNVPHIDFDKNALVGYEVVDFVRHLHKCDFLKSRVFVALDAEAYTINKMLCHKPRMAYIRDISTMLDVVKVVYINHLVGFDIGKIISVPESNYNILVKLFELLDNCDNSPEVVIMGNEEYDYCDENYRLAVELTDRINNELYKKEEK